MTNWFTKKHCPNCGGNIYLERDLFSWYEQCLLCSKIWYLDTIVEVHGEDHGAVVTGQAEGSALVSTRR
jgi:hypothetical protein